MTLDEFGEQMPPHVVRHAAEMMLRPNPLFDLLMKTYKPKVPTLRERVEMLRLRVRDAWRVLAGRASISDDIW
jgi:hypothetical protein